MPDGKPAGQRCVQLSPENLCRIFGQAGRPACCAGLQASPQMCGQDREHALVWLADLERLTAP